MIERAKEALLSTLTSRQANPMKTRLPFVVCATLALLVPSTAVLAHTEAGVTGGLLSGFTHPIYGWDHVVAMIAVGLWGAFLGSPALWVLPVTFPLVMALGGALGVVGVPLPEVELFIALSGVVLGLMVALAVRAPLWLAALLVAVFAIFHGHAHGTELPTAANPFAYAIGFVVATGLLHLAGIAFGFLIRLPYGRYAVQVAGALIAVIGGVFLFGYA